MNFLRPVFCLVGKEFRQIFRQRSMVAIILFLPLVQLFLFAYAMNADLRLVRLKVLDQDRTARSRALVVAFTASGYFRSVSPARNPAELESALVEGAADLTLWIPAGFTADLQRGAAAVALGVDGSNSSTGGRAAGYAAAVLARETLQELTLTQARHPLPPGWLQLVEPRPRYLFNPALESRLYMVPGVVVMILTVISAMLSGMAVVRERELGTIEQLLVSPLSPFQLVAGKLIPFALLGLLEFALGCAVAVLWFKVPLQGSALTLAVAAGLYLLATLGLGLLASTVSSTQQQAMFTVWFFLVFGILMSGFFYPISNMPDWAALLTYLNPLRYILAIVRGVFLKGAGFADLGREFAGLAGLGALLFFGAVTRFRKRLG